MLSMVSANGQTRGAACLAFAQVHRQARDGKGMSSAMFEPSFADNRRYIRGGLQALFIWSRLPTFAAASASTLWWMVKRASSRRSETPVLS